MSDNNIDISKFDSDKEGYLSNYEEYFSKYKDKGIKLLELGIYHGGSLLMWQDYFSKGEIVGVDINKFEYPEDQPRINIYQGDQKDYGLLDRISHENAPEGFDIIIDDASHFGLETWASFVHLFKHSLKSGGIYVIEDWGTGYWPHYPTGRNLELDAHHISHHLHNETGGVFKSKGLWNRMVTFSKKRFRSHDFGMVGVVKQLIDEVGLGTATDSRYSAHQDLKPMISKMIVSEGQMILFKI